MGGSGSNVEPTLLRLHRARGLRNFARKCVSSRPLFILLPRAFFPSEIPRNELKENFKRTWWTRILPFGLGSTTFSRDRGKNRRSRVPLISLHPSSPCSSDYSVTLAMLESCECNFYGTVPRRIHGCNCNPQSRRNPWVGIKADTKSSQNIYLHNGTAVFVWLQISAHAYPRSRNLHEITE